MGIDDETTTGSANLKVIASPLVRVPLRSESATDTAWRSAPLPAGSGTINPADSSTASHLMVNEAICALVTGLLGRYVRAVPTWAMPAEAMALMLSSCQLPSSSVKWSRSEEHTSELQSLMRTSYAVFCLKKKNTNKHTSHNKQLYNCN